MLEKKANELIDEAKELMDFCIKQMDVYDIKNMDMDNFAAIQRCVKLVDSASELMVEQSRMMDDMDRKLDVILEILGKAEES